MRPQEPLKTIKSRCEWHQFCRCYCPLSSGRLARFHWLFGYCSSHTDEWHCNSSQSERRLLTQANHTVTTRNIPWNKGKLLGQKKTTQAQRSRGHPGALAAQRVPKLQRTVASSKNCDFARVSVTNCFYWTIDSRFGSPTTSGRQDLRWSLHDAWSDQIRFFQYINKGEEVR